MVPFGFDIAEEQKHGPYRTNSKLWRAVNTFIPARSIPEEPQPLESIFRAWASGELWIEPEDAAELTPPILSSYVGPYES